MSAPSRGWVFRRRPLLGLRAGQDERCPDKTHCLAGSHFGSDLSVGHKPPFSADPGNQLASIRAITPGTHFRDVFDSTLF